MEKFSIENRMSGGNIFTKIVNARMQRADNNNNKSENTFAVRHSSHTFNCDKNARFQSRFFRSLYRRVTLNCILLIEKHKSTYRKRVFDTRTQTHTLTPNVEILN